MNIGILLKKRAYTYPTYVIRVNIPFHKGKMDVVERRDRTQAKPKHKENVKSNSSTSGTPSAILCAPKN